jgi:alpha-L-arabinofuranosidase
MKRFSSLLCLAALSGSLALAGAADVTLTVHADKPGAKINPAMWGVFFEDINFGADGGLYAELVKNRSFEFPDALMGWKAGGANGVAVLTDSPFSPAQPHYARLKSGATLSNEGFRGMGIHAGETYNFSTEARVVEGKPTLKISLVGSTGAVLASTTLKSFDGKWSEETCRLKSSAQEAKAHLELTIEGGSLDLDLVSLFPQHTWKDRPNGLRADMVQMLADLKPGFVRFPGGCIVEGRVLTNRYEWKNTIGDTADRKLIMNRWNVEFASRGKGAADYYQSFGLGFFEYFQLCEDIGAEPLPILNCGMACQFNSGELVAVDQLDPYIQDALDLIEFANGSAKTTWGAKRAAMGHPKPFNLKLLGVGNEQWGPQYIERYTKFAQVLKAKHPEVQLIAASGPDPSGERFDFLWSKLRGLNADIIDEHFYRPPDWFFQNVHRYDSYDRNGPKVFAGEYAAHVKSRANDLESAIAEAAMMTGFERNADVVRMASYAPLFAHVDAWQWNPDLIWVDNLRVIGTPDYYVQQMFSRNRGDVVLPIDVQNSAVQQAAAAGAVGVGTWNTEAEFKDIKVTAPGGKVLFQSDFTSTNGVKFLGEGEWSVQDGALRQTAEKEFVRATFGDKSWTDYTIELKARKIAGSEGFLVLFHINGDEDRTWWNVGGWNNTQHGLELDETTDAKRGHIETNRWYDLKVQVAGNTVKCWLDGKLIHNVNKGSAETLFASAANDERNSEIIVKVVNAASKPVEANLALVGTKSVKDGTVTLLTSANLNDENSLDNPRKVAPVVKKLDLPGSTFTHTFPANSVSVLRIPAR